MLLLALTLLALALLVGFLLLTRHEAKTGTRLFAVSRDAADRKITALGERIEATSLSHLVREGAWSLARHFLHDIAHVALATVRVVERSLARLAHRLQQASGKGGE